MLKSRFAKLRGVACGVQYLTLNFKSILSDLSFFFFFHTTLFEYELIYRTKSIWSNFKGHTTKLSSSLLPKRGKLMEWLWNKSMSLNVRTTYSVWLCPSVSLFGKFISHICRKKKKNIPRWKVMYAKKKKKNQKSFPSLSFC